MPHLFLLALAAILSALLTPVVRRVAVRLGALDRPGLRRVHATPVPRLGGLAIVAASLGTIGAGPLNGGDGSGR